MLLCPPSVPADVPPAERASDTILPDELQLDVRCASARPHHCPVALIAVGVYPQPVPATFRSMMVALPAPD